MEADRATKLWPFVASAVVPVVLLAPSAIDGTQAIWAQVTATVLMLAGAVVVLVTYWLWHRHRLRLVSAVTAGLCYLMSLVVMILGNVPPTVPASAGVVPSSSSPTPTVAASPSSSETPGGDRTASASGRCWSPSRKPVDCREPHRFEQIEGAAKCDLATVVLFLGGAAAVDVTTARAAVMPGGACAVQTAGDVMGSARNVLQAGSAASWRRCYDRRTSTNVDCSQLHSGEYVATGSLRRATQEECLAAAERYLDQTPANVAEDLTVDVLDVKSGTPDPARCTIDARGTHFLDDSVRNLGSHPVPIHTS